MLPVLHAPYPIAQKCRPQYSFSRCGNSCSSFLDVRPLSRFTSSLTYRSVVPQHSQKGNAEPSADLQHLGHIRRTSKKLVELEEHLFATRRENHK